MPDTQKYKSVSVPTTTYKMLVELSKEIFEAPLTISKTIEYLARKETKKKEWQKQLLNAQNARVQAT